MFTGIIEEIGTVREVSARAGSSRLTICGNVIFDDLKLGDSVAVNGVCLTAAAVSRDTFTADVMHETLNRSSLGSLKPQSRVNLERAMSAAGRFGGHIVSGHIDDVGEIIKVTKDDNAYLYTIKANDKVMRYIVEKGSVAIDGISLTVASVRTGDFCVSIIPHTQRSTILGDKSVGAKVNLESDMIGKYVERLMLFDGEQDVKTGRFVRGQKEGAKDSQSVITKEYLARLGY